MILVYHIPKTGGTTILTHAKEHLPGDQVFGFGYTSYWRRFLAGEPLFEELGPADYERIRLVLGHQVGTDAIEPVLPYMQPRLLACVRDPYEHFVSLYRHHLLTIEARGEFISAPDYFRSRIKDRVAAGLFLRFSKICTADEASEEGVIDILRCFEFLMTTEDLAIQSRPFVRHLGIPDITTRARVSKNAYSLDGLSRDEVYDHFPLDRKIFDMLRTGNRAATPIAYDPAFASARFSGLGARDRDNMIYWAYRNLASFIRRENRTEAAQLFLRLTGREAEEKYEPILSLTLTEEQQLDANARARSEKEKADIYRQQHMPEKAIACLEKTVALNDGYVDAYLMLAQLHNGLKDPTRALTYTDALLDIRPGDARALELRAELKAKLSA